MSGLKLTIPTKFTDASLPVYKTDPLLVDGSLLLVDPTHPADPWAAGLPVDNQLISNLASEQASSLLVGEVNPTFINGGFTDSTMGKLERTAKGGIHGIISQAKEASLISTIKGGIQFPEALWQYVKNNPTHQYYFSTWEKVTRQPVTNKFPVQAIIGGGSTTNNYLFVFQNSTRPLSSQADKFLGGKGNIAETQSKVRNIAVNGVTGDMNVVTTPRGDSMGWGRFRGAATGYFSWVFYRVYMEDLTVSGRTYAEVDAADTALFTEQFAAGGRYNGDTFTDPATIA